MNDYGLRTNDRSAGALTTVNASFANDFWQDCDLSTKFVGYSNYSALTSASIRLIPAFTSYCCCSACYMP